MEASTPRPGKKERNDGMLSGPEKSKIKWVTRPDNTGKKELNVNDESSSSSYQLQIIMQFLPYLNSYFEELVKRTLNSFFQASKVQILFYLTLNFK